MGAGSQVGGLPTAMGGPRRRGHDGPTLPLRVVGVRPSGPVAPECGDGGEVRRGAEYRRWSEDDEVGVVAGVGVRGSGPVVGKEDVLGEGPLGWCLEGKGGRIVGGTNLEFGKVSGKCIVKGLI